MTKSMLAMMLVLVGVDVAAADPDPEDPCVVDVAVGTKMIKYSGAGMVGETTRVGQDLSALRPLAKSCSAAIRVEDAVLYQDVAATLDDLLKVGFRDIGVVADTAKPRFHASADLAIADTPVVLVSKTAVIVGIGSSKKTVGKPGDKNLADEIKVALAAAPKSPSRIILQADRDTPFGVLRKVMSGAKADGVDDILFAIKNTP